MVGCRTIDPVRGELSYAWTLVGRVGVAVGRNPRDRPAPAGSIGTTRPVAYGFALQTSGRSAVATGNSTIPNRSVSGGPSVLGSLTTDLSRPSVSERGSSGPREFGQCL